MELRHLRYFVTVAQELNFTRAAEKLNTVQPSLSQQIKDLEREVGVQLLERNNRKVGLTEAGQAFLKEALLSLEHAERHSDCQTDRQCAAGPAEYRFCPGRGNESLSLYHAEYPRAFS